MTTDGGRTWRRTPAAPEGWETRDLAATGSSTWVVGQRATDQDSYIAHSGDAGQTWDYPLVAAP